MRLSEEQRAIANTAQQFAQQHLPISQLRALRDTRDEHGLSREAWRDMAALGLSGVCLPEQAGGAGLGCTELGLILEACGHSLAATPLLSSIVLGAGAIVEADLVERHAKLLCDVIAGDSLLAWAHEERPHFAPYAIQTRAEQTAGGYRLSGTKCFVLDGHIADHFIVVARSAGGIEERAGVSLFLVASDAPGVHTMRLNVIDGRNAARVEFDGTSVTSNARLGPLGDAADIIDALLARATVSLCAEMLGGLCEAFDRTVQYLKDRRQFGVPIGSFQALQHRAAWMFCEVALTRSVVAEAQRAIDQGREDAATLVSIAKARTSDTYLHVAKEAIQLHGGVGVTDEFDIGFFLKRAQVCAMMFGSASYHRARFATLQGY
jgi:alkylation response protein AidB-like acyl-CoA dehydrogenase